MTETNEAPAPGSTYILPTDENERRRLQDQHALLKRTLYDNNLTGGVTIEAGSHVLDVGTGSGAWITDLANEVSTSVHLYGVDISTKLFPTPASSNITFAGMSATSLLSKWTDKFTFVHQRLLLPGLLASEWHVAVAEAFRVLVPGGRAQYVEIDSSNWWTDTELSKKHHALIAALHKEKKQLFDCGSQLPRILNEAGFSDVHTEQKRLPLGRGWGRDGVAGNRCIGGALKGMKQSVLKAGGLGFAQTEQEYDEQIDALIAEWDQGEGVYLPFIFVYAQKPVYR